MSTTWFRILLILLFFSAHACKRGSKREQLPQSSITGTEKVENAVSDDDAALLKDTYTENLAMIESSKIALNSSRNQTVIELSRSLIDQRLRQNEIIRKLCTRRNVSLENSLDREQARSMSVLSNKSGKGFDKVYTGYLEKSFSEDLLKFKKASVETTDDEIRMLLKDMQSGIEQQAQKNKELAAVLQ
jgi:predicted outer membrane protein